MGSGAGRDPHPDPGLQPSPWYWKTLCEFKGTPGNTRSTEPGLLESTVCAFTLKLREVVKRQVLSLGAGGWCPGSPCRRWP